MRALLSELNLSDLFLAIRRVNFRMILSTSFLIEKLVYLASALKLRDTSSSYGSLSASASGISDLASSRSDSNLPSFSSSEPSNVSTLF